MGHQKTVGFFVLTCVLQTLAFHRHQGSRNVAPQNCGRVTFTQNGQNTHFYYHEEVRKKCYNLHSTHPTALKLNGQRCAYKVAAFPTDDCDEESDYTEYPMNPGTQVVHLNKLPVCSFFIKKLPSDGTPIIVKFMKNSFSLPIQYIERAACYNICHDSSNFKYPDTVQLYRENGHIARGFSVQLFSEIGCPDDDMITNEEHERIMMLTGELYLTPITRQATTLSYRIFNDN